jgi:hypothetical protein
MDSGCRNVVDHLAGTGNLGSSETGHRDQSEAQVFHHHIPPTTSDKIVVIRPGRPDDRDGKTDGC